MYPHKMRIFEFLSVEHASGFLAEGLWTPLYSTASYPSSHLSRPLMRIGITPHPCMGLHPVQRNADTRRVRKKLLVHFLISGGNTHGVSTDVLIRVLAATGYRAEVRVKKAAV